MKQNISKEQWMNFEEKKREMFLNAIGESEASGVAAFFPPPNIGKMIEFLEGVHDDTYIDDRFHHCLFLDTPAEDLVIGWSNNSGKSKELCDALWEAVKHKLNK